MILRENPPCLSQPCPVLSKIASSKHISDDRMLKLFQLNEKLGDSGESKVKRGRPWVHRPGPSLFRFVAQPLRAKAVRFECVSRPRSP